MAATHVVPLPVTVVEVAPVPSVPVVYVVPPMICEVVETSEGKLSVIEEEPTDVAIWFGVPAIDMVVKKPPLPTPVKDPGVVVMSLIETRPRLFIVKRLLFDVVENFSSTRRVTARLP
jgi:hypothetical protein